MNNLQPKCILPNSFFEGLNPPNVDPMSLDMIEWEDEQIRRCIEGWADGGFAMTGRNYFYLNFYKTDIVLPNGKIDTANLYYSDEDQHIFNEIEKAEEQGKGFMLITGRGAGKTLLMGSIVGHGYSFNKNSEAIVSASTTQAIAPFWDKLQRGINSLPDFLRHNRLIDNKDYFESGFREKHNGIEKIFGYRSKIRKVVYDDKAGKTRGTRPNVHVFEEIGSWTGAAKLKECYLKTEPSWWRGAKFTCLPLLIGTGGEMDNGGSEDAKEMMYNPEEFNLLSYKQPDAKPTGYFLPAYRKLGGMYEETGVCDHDKAKEFLEKRREKKKANIQSYNQEIQEFPFTLEEAFLISGTNVFDSSLIYARLNEIQRSTEQTMAVQKGNLTWKKAGNTIVGVKWTPSETGIFEILEHPRKDENKQHFKHLYVSGCDSYDSTATEDSTGESNRSRGSIYIYKRAFIRDDFHSAFVAKCTIRERNSDKFYEATAKLNMYYNSKMLFEHTKVGIYQYYRENGFIGMLLERPTVAYAGIKKRTSNNRFGLTMPAAIKQYCVEEYDKYITENIDKMYFVSQLMEAINYVWGSPKFDETVASFLAIVADKDLFEKQVDRIKKKKPLSLPRFDRDHDGYLILK